MKKVLIPALLICMCLFTGCTKKYDSVKDYSDAMKEVRTKLGDYTIVTEISSKDTNLNCKTYKKGDKWRTETSKDNGNNYTDGILYDGNEIYAYSEKQKFAMAIPLKQLIDKDGKNKDAFEIAMKMVNPTGILFHWDIAESDSNTEIWSFGKITKKNNYKCRMLNNAAGGHICVSDKYGIAVWAKINTPKDGDVEYNVKNIDNKPLGLSDLDLPNGIKKMSMSDFFSDMAKMVKTLENDENNGDEEE